MKKLALLAALALTACASQPKGDSSFTSVTTFADIGNPDAIVCDAPVDAKAIVALAGNNQSAEFVQFVRDARKANRCRFLNNTRPLEVLGYAPIRTLNGTLFVIEFVQDAKVLYSSPNYFDKAGPQTLLWERALQAQP